MAAKASGSVYINKSVKKKQGEKEERKRVENLVKESHTLIYKVSSVFPFQIFPDSVIVEANKVTIINRGFLTTYEFPILIEDIKTVRVFNSIIFASLIFEVAGYEENPPPVAHLWPEKAEMAKKYIIGLVNAKRKYIDTSKINLEKLKEELEEIGTPNAEEDTET